MPLASTIFWRLPTGAPFLATKIYTVTCSPIGSDFLVQPRSSITCGGSVAAVQCVTPFSSVTSKKIWLWGLVHSNFVSVPFKTTGLLMSYTFAVPWCAIAGLGAQEKTDAHDYRDDQLAFHVVLHVMPPLQ